MSENVCPRQFHMYVWSVKPDFVAIAQASSVAEARELLISNRVDAIGESGDGSCHKRDEAREFVREFQPDIYHYPNAHFALTDSAELEEQEAETRRQSDRADKAERERDEAVGLILSGFTYDPGHSDLDDEQPITVRMTLGDYRKVRNMR